MNRTILSIIVAGLFTGIGGTATAQNVTAGEKPATAPSVTNSVTDPKATSKRSANVAEPAEHTQGDPISTKQTPARSAGPATESGTKKSTNAGAEHTQGDPISTKQTPARSAESGSDKSTDKSAKSAGKADYTAAKNKAQSQYKDAKAKCDAMQGDAMKSCMTDARTARATSLAEAKTQWETLGGAKAAPGDAMKQPGSVSQPDNRSAVDADPNLLKTADRGGQPAPNQSPAGSSSVNAGTHSNADRSGQPDANDGVDSSSNVRTDTNVPGDRSGQAAPGADSDGASSVKSGKIAAIDQSQVRYKEAATRCEMLQTTASRQSCMTLATKERDDALAAANAREGNTGSTRDDRSESEAEEGYENVSTAHKANESAGAVKVNSQ